MNNERKITEFFAAANSGRGFVNFYPKIFYKRGIERRYLIKGGPGTGKSTFMRIIAQNASFAGYDVEYYRCSSDPSSLDAIILGGRIAIMDATSPHIADADIAGAREELVDLGAFWYSKGLFSERGRIEELSRMKKMRYARAYEFLGAAMKIDESDRKLAASYIDLEKINSATQRTVAKIPKGTGFDMRIGICDSVGMKGRVRLDTYERMAKKVYIIRDFLKSGTEFLKKLVDFAKENGNKITVSYFPVNTDHPDAVFFEESGDAFVLRDLAKVGDEVYPCECIYINMKRFVKKTADIAEIKKAKKEISHDTRMLRELIALAIKELEIAGDHHFELEKIYRKYMDFDAEDAFAKRFSDSVIKSMPELDATEY